MIRLETYKFMIHTQEEMRLIKVARNERRSYFVFVGDCNGGGFPRVTSSRVANFTRSFSSLPIFTRLESKGESLGLKLR